MAATERSKHRYNRPQRLDFSSPLSGLSASRMMGKVTRHNATGLHIDTGVSSPPTTPITSPSRSDFSGPIDFIQQDSPVSFEANHSLSSPTTPVTPVWSGPPGGELTPGPIGIQQPQFQLYNITTESKESGIVSSISSTSKKLVEPDSKQDSEETSKLKSKHGLKAIGNHVTLQENGDITYAFDEVTRETYTCKTFNRNDAKEMLLPYFMLSYDLAFLHLDRLVEDGDQSHALFELPLGGDLHSYIRLKKRLKEDVARRLIEPIFELVAECHNNNFILRDIKLRKCVFLDPTRTQLVYQGLEDGRSIGDGCDDVIFDRIGCPAYVSPEVVQSSAGYSGRAADMWGLGVVLYTMLVGRYPFQNNSSRSILQQVRKGDYHLPAWLSLQARCLLRSLLCVDPASRICATEALTHAWFRSRVKTTPRPVPTGFRPSTKSVAEKGLKEKGRPVAPPDCVVEADWQVPDQSVVAAFSGFL